MIREDVVEWLRYPKVLERQYDMLLCDLDDLINNPVHGVSYDRIRTGRITDLSDRSVKIEEKAVQAAKKLLELFNALRERYEILLENNPRPDILSKYYFSCYNPKTIAEEYGVRRETVYRWINEGIAALMADPILTAKISADNKNNAENVENSV